MLPLPDRPPRRRNETRDVLRPILLALNAMPGVRVARNHNVGSVVPYAHRLDAAPPRFVAGLGLGSADLVGLVTCMDTAIFCGPHFGRAFCLEVKLPGTTGRAGAIRPDQRRWLASVRKLGGFATVVRSVAEAVEAVGRCREGASE